MTDPIVGESRLSAGTSAVGAGPRDEPILCWCNKVTHGEFRDAVWDAPGIQFYDLCASIGVGTKCTSCLLDAEAAYDEAARNPAAGSRRADKGRPTERRSGKRIFYDWLDRLSPRAAIPLRGIVPILTGDGVSTIISVTNSVSRAIGTRTPDFAVRFDVRDANGHAIESIAKTLAPGERLDHEVLGSVGQNRLSTGSCRITMSALQSAYRGSSRPHFTIKTKASLSTVHSQGNGRRSAFVQTTRPPSGETQYLSVVNCEPEPATVQVRTIRGDHEFMARQVSLPPLGAALIDLDLGGAAGNSDRPLVATLKSDRPVRTHVMVAAGSPVRISMHHI